MKHIGILILVATTIVATSPALSQDQNGDRRERSGGGPGGEPGGRPNDGNRPQGGDRNGPDRGQQNMQQQRSGGDNGGRSGNGGGQVPNGGTQQDRGPGAPGYNPQRPGQQGPNFQQNRPGNDRGNRDDRGSYDRGSGYAGGNGYGGGNYSHNRPPSGNYWRPGNTRPSSNYWQNNRWNNRPVYAPAYRYPRGYSYRQWRPGLILPSLFLGSSYYFDGFGDLGLSAPPYGYRWVRYGPDLVLVDVRSGRIRDVRYGIFG